jgi:hypothetical protein
MNRAEIRRAKRELEKKYILTGAQLQERDNKIIDKCTEEAFILILGLATLVVRDDFGKLMKKEGRESRFIDFMLEKYSSTELSIEEAKAVIRDNSDIEDIKEAI